MKVLKTGKVKEITFKRTCGSCSSKLEYTKSDIKHDRDGNYIICPVCGQFIATSSQVFTDRSKDC